MTKSLICINSATTSPRGPRYHQAKGGDSRGVIVEIKVPELLGCRASRHYRGPKLFTETFKSSNLGFALGISTLLKYDVTVTETYILEQDIYIPEEPTSVTRQ